MEESSLDFLDQLVPSAQDTEGDAAPSMRRSGPVPAGAGGGAPGTGTAPGSSRSLAPPPAAVLAAVRERPGHDIDIVIDESAPYHEPPTATAAGDGESGLETGAEGDESYASDTVQMPWMTHNSRPPSSAPPRKIPLPGEAIPPARASESPPALHSEFTDHAHPSFEDHDEGDDSSDDETIAMETETLVMTSGIGQLNSNAAAALGTPRKSEPAPAGAGVPSASASGLGLAGSELFGELQGPARRSAGPPPAPSMRASAGPPPPPRPSARPPTPPAARASDPYAAQAPYAAPGALAEPEQQTVPLMAAMSEPPLPGSTLPSKPVVVSPRVWSVDSIPPDPPVYAPSAFAGGPGLSAHVSSSLPPLAPPPGAGPGAIAATTTAPQGISVAPTGYVAPAGYVAPSAYPPPSAFPAPITVGVSVAPVISPAIAEAASRPDASEWDEAPTNIYTREVHGRDSSGYGSIAPLPAPGLPVLPGSSPSGAAASDYDARPMASVSVPRASLPMPSLPPMPTVPSMRAPQRAALWQARLQENIRWVAIGGVALFALLLWLVIPSGGGKGELVINVSGPAGIAVDGVKVYIDEQLTCEESPCQLKKLEAKGHVITIEAPGYMRTAPTAVLVKGDNTTLHNVELVPSKGGSSNSGSGSVNAGLGVESSGGTGFAIADSPGDLSVSLDGKNIGKPPLKLDALSPGEHVLRVTGGDRLEALERTLTLRDGEMQNLGALKLRVLRGRLKLVAGMNATGAQTTLDGRLTQLPHDAELDATVTHRVVMTREGHTPLKLDVAFEPGVAERELVLDLVPEGAEAVQDQLASDAVVNEEPARPASGRPAASRGKASSGSSSKSSSGTGPGKLTMLSVPESVVILDGKPLGKSPRRAVSVSAGPHNIVFVHPTKGRKRASANVPAGGSKTIAVKF